MFFSSPARRVFPLIIAALFSLFVAERFDQQTASTTNGDRSGNTSVHPEPLYTKRTRTYIQMHANAPWYAAHARHLMTVCPFYLRFTQQSFILFFCFFLFLVSVFRACLVQASTNSLKDDPGTPEECNLFVGDLARNLTEEKLEKAFEQHGKVTESARRRMKKCNEGKGKAQKTFICCCWLQPRRVTETTVDRRRERGMVLFRMQLARCGDSEGERGWLLGWVTGREGWAEREKTWVKAEPGSVLRHGLSVVFQHSFDAVLFS